MQDLLHLLRRCPHKPEQFCFDGDRTHINAFRIDLFSKKRGFGFGNMTPDLLRTPLCVMVLGGDPLDDVVHLLQPAYVPSSSLF